MPLKSVCASFVILCLGLCLSAEAAIESDQSDTEILRQIAIETTAGKVLEFLKSRPLPQKAKKSLIDNARPEDRIELMRLLSTWKTDDLRLRAEVGTVIASSNDGRTVVEVTGLEIKEQFLLNERVFTRPASGSVLEALRKHLQAKRSTANLRQLPLRQMIAQMLPTALASASDESPQLAALPAYLYIEFLNAQETPSSSHSAEDEALKSATRLQSIVMPSGGNSISVHVSRLFSDEKSHVTCDGSRAKGIVQLNGELQRFEVRANGDVVISPPFEKGSALLLRPSRIDLAQSSKMISDLMAEYRIHRSAETALSLIDGPIRQICERLQLLKPNAKTASLCDRLYEKQISLEGRCKRFEHGIARTECERASGILLPGNRKTAFERDLRTFMDSEGDEIIAAGKSVESAQVIGRRMHLHQCLDGVVCEKTHFPMVLDIVQPSKGEATSDVKELFSFRHPKTNSAPLVKYMCEVQNETCAMVTTTAAAHALPKKDLETLRSRIAKANLIRPWQKDAFLEQASALRPLGQCCGSASCRSKLQNATANSIQFSNSEGTRK